MDYLHKTFSFHRCWVLFTFCCFFAFLSSKDLFSNLTYSRTLQFYVVYSFAYLWMTSSICVVCWFVYIEHVHNNLPQIFCPKTYIFRCFLSTMVNFMNFLITFLWYFPIFDYFFFAPWFSSRNNCFKMAAAHGLQ